MSVTKKKIDESAFIIAKDNITNNVQTVVVPSNFQVGLKTSPSDLTLTGKFSTSEKDYVANSSNNWTLSLEDHVTVSSISTTYSSSSRPSEGYVVINLPKNPRVGQLVIIKEFSGTASVIPLRIYDASSKTIDGANYKTISSDYGALQFFWQGTNWISISNATVASGAAPDSASYVVIGSNAILTNERTLTAGSGISIVDGGAGAAVTISTTGGGSGDVIGPASSTDNAIVRFDLTTGKLIQNSGVTIDDSNNVTIPGDISVNGGDITTTAATTNLVNAATTINLGSTAVTRAINIGTNATNVQTINIGTGAAANIISIGSATGAASLTLQSGTGGINVGTSNVARTINIGSDPAGTATTQQTINIGAKNTALGGFNAVNIADEDSHSGHVVNIISSNGTQTTGTSAIQIGTVVADCTVTIGSTTDYSITTLNGGTGGVNINSTHATLADAIIGNATVGAHPDSAYTSFAIFGHSSYDYDAAPGSYALLAVGSTGTKNTWLNAPSGAQIRFANNDVSIGYMDDNEVSLTGKASTATTLTLGNTAGASSATIDAGTGNINIGTSNSVRTINIGSDPAGTATTMQTINIGAKNTSGFNMLHLVDEDSSLGHEIYILSDNGTQTGGTSVVEIGTVAAATTIDIGKSTVGVKNVTIGGTDGASSLTLDSGTGNINIGTSTASGRTINVGTGTANQYINIGNNSTANQVVIYGGAPFVGVGGIYLTGSAGTTYTIGGETGTGTISLGRSTASNTINIGNGTTASGNTQTVNIAASASGTGVATVTIGNTNGASSLALRAGTGDITMSGIVKNSSQPGFLTTLSTSQLNFTTSSDVTVLFDSEIFDNASNFDTGAYTFTAPEAGKYLFNAAVRIDNIDTAADYYTLYLITSNRNYRLAIIDPGQFAADLVYWHLNGSAIADMDASDTAYIVIRQQAGTAQSDIISATTNSFFSGWMLG